MPILLIAYLAYIAVFPEDEFYDDEFKKISGVKLPPNREIVYKSATYPGPHGDYSSVAVIETDTSFYNKLPNKLTRYGMKLTEGGTGDPELRMAINSIKQYDIVSSYSKNDGHGHICYIALLSDGKTIISHYVSY